MNENRFERKFNKFKVEYSYNVYKKDHFMNTYEFIKNTKNLKSMYELMNILIIK